MEPITPIKRPLSDGTPIPLFPFELGGLEFSLRHGYRNERAFLHPKDDGTFSLAFDLSAQRLEASGESLEDALLALRRHVYTTWAVWLTSTRWWVGTSHGEDFAEFFLMWVWVSPVIGPHAPFIESTCLPCGCRGTFPCAKHDNQC